jgi:hypothetical protein
MKRLRSYLIPAIIVVLLVALSFILPEVLPPAAGQTARFLSLFIAVLLTFIVFIWFLGRTFYRRIPARIHGIIEMALIVCILGGVVAMFQPWSLRTYHLGFVLLLYAVLAFTVWSHIVPRGAREEEEDVAAAAAGENG